MTMSILLLAVVQSSQPMPYFDPAGRVPSTYADYAAAQVDAPFEARVVARSRGPEGTQALDGRYSRLVLVFVNAGLYPSIEPELSTWQGDLTFQGYSVKLVTVSGGKAQNLRQALQVHRDSGLIGTVMIGNLPVAWWSDGSSGEDYPLDFFFTDLDGTWSDGNSDGRYDSHGGNTAPDIWLGRIDASRLTYGSEAQITRDYLRRNHAFRTGQLVVPHRGLVLSNVFYTSNHGMTNMLSSVTNYGCNSPTSGYFYKNKLLEGYEFVHLVSHSSPWVNSFFATDEMTGTGSVFNFEIAPLGPHAVFYFLNACMASRFTERDNSGTWYALAGPFGQVVLGSSQTMYGIDDLSDLYGYLGVDSTVGGAFLRWHKENYTWMSATCILGDPTLKVNRTFESGPAPQPPEYRQPASALDWNVYGVDTTNYVGARPRLGCSQGRIRLVYDSGRIVRSDNFFSWFNGTDFSRPESVAWHEYYDLFPSCCTDSSGRFWMAWQTFRDYVSGYEHFGVVASYYNGSTWSSPSRLGPVAGYHDLQPAVAAARGDTVWCAFQSWRNGQADIWVASEVHAGAWTTPVRLTADSLEQVWPCITVDHDGHPWVFWMSQINGRWCIQGRVNDNGWQPAFVLDTLGSSGPPRAAVDGAGHVWVVYSRATGMQSDICYSCYADSAWSEPAVLAATPEIEQLPDITTALDGTVWACWQADTNTFGPSNIYVSQYADGWTLPAAVTSDNAHSADPTITCDTSGNIWIAYDSDRRGYWNIYAVSSSPTGSAELPTSGPDRVVCAAPNPFNEAVTFAGPGGFAVDVYGLDGRKLAQIRSRGGQAVWSPSQLARGVYIARVSSARGRTVLKLIRTE